MSYQANVRWRQLLLGVVLFQGLMQHLVWGQEPNDPRVVVYSATPAGVAAAIAAAEDGESVLLVEPTQRIGGLLTSGLSHTDIRTFESVTGSFFHFSQRVAAFYREKYGADSAQYRACERGIFGEPSVNLLILERMLAEYPTLRIVRAWRLADVTMSETTHEPNEAATSNDSKRRVIRSASFITPSGTVHQIAAALFVDASYEGDLMAAAKVRWRTGREARAEYDESLAPEAADTQLQAYNFRFIMTRDVQNRVLPVAPEGYRREDFVDVLPVLAEGKIKRVFEYPSNCLFKAHLPALPNDKYDINDVSSGLVRLSLPGVNLDWPNGDAETRARIFREQRRDQVGLLFFLQNDPAVPTSLRQEAREWGWCRDEFVDSEHLPPQLYVREARRMVGKYIFTERDTDHASDDARAVRHDDAIAIGDYGPNCHGTMHEGPRFGGRHRGEFYKQVVPYQIPYGVLVPRDVDNLLVPGAMSASHVGFCALRLEPIWMSLGQAAGHAAHQAHARQLSVGKVPLQPLQARLHERNAATIYLSDIPPTHADFAAVQWWGLQGGWHGLAPHPEKPGQRGRNLHGQYFEAFPNHAAELHRPLDDVTLKSWRTIEARLKLAPSNSSQHRTRGEFVRDAWRRVNNLKAK